MLKGDCIQFGAVLGLLSLASRFQLLPLSVQGLGFGVGPQGFRSESGFRV
jgi:hypothetical protein